MRISADNIFTYEIWWYGIDKHGYVFCCTSGGVPNIPEFVCCNHEETVFLNRFFVFDFDKEKNLENFDSIPDEVFKKIILDTFIADDNVILALKGITSFDIVLEYLFDPESKREFNDHKYEYKKVTQPTELLHFDQLPENVQKMMDSHRMNNVDVTKTDYFFVDPNPNY